MSLYQQHIREELALTGNLGLDPRHIEAFIRIEYGTLDHLDKVKFRREVKIAAECVALGGKEEAEALAASYGL